MKYALFFPVALCLLLITPPVPAPAAGEDYAVGIPEISGTGQRQAEVEALLREAYARIGVTVRFEYLPLLREYDSAAQRRIDASAARTPIAAQGDPDLVLVETPLLRTTVVAYSRAPRAGLDTWDDLRGLKTGYLRGDRTTCKFLTCRNPGAYRFASLKAGFSALREERLDVFVTHTTIVRLGGMAEAAQDLAASPPLFEGFFHHALNLRHADLAPRLSAALREMIESGASERLMGRFSPLLPDPPER